MTQTVFLGAVFIYNMRVILFSCFGLIYSPEDDLGAF